LTIQLQLPGVKLGVLEAEGLRVEPAREELAREMHEVCERIRTSLTLEQVAALDSIRAVRAMFRAWGIDPSKYRPSSEALTRRVVQGKGLYRLSNAVDIVNLCSVETGWPYGCYDAAKLTPPITFRHGQHSETYERIGRAMWHLDGQPILADQSGPFGSPMSDSTRTMITEHTTALLLTIFCPLGTANEKLQFALDRFAALLSRHASASTPRVAIALP
jgi:DNA/RNA-binding domain of Phe-tRNA-synthetase-like protein